MINSHKAKFGIYTATSVVIANMIGTGVFGSQHSKGEARRFERTSTP